MSLSVPAELKPGKFFFYFLSSLHLKCVARQLIGKIWEPRVVYASKKAEAICRRGTSN